jgi:hypothetical protein
MLKKLSLLIGMLLICTMALPLLGQEVEPNNTIETASDVVLDVALDAQLTVDDTLDIFRVNAEDTRMYLIAALSDPVVFQAKSVLQMDVLDAAGSSILTSSPKGRYDQAGTRLAGWVPPETSVYYIKVWASPEMLAEVDDASYQVRFWYGTPVADAEALHEPDDTAAEADVLGDAPTDGQMIRGYLYKHWVEGDTIDTNFNDFDLYKVTVPEAGMVLIAETFTSARLYDHPEWCRDVDTEIYLLDENGAIIPGMKNDDKAAWAGDPWDKGNALSPGVNNTYSRLVTPAIPAAGVYYVQVNSYYNNLLEGRTKSPANTDKDPGGGEYLVSFNLVAGDDPSVASTFLPLDEVRDGSIAESDTMDVWQIQADDDKMYSITTITDPVNFQAKSVLQMDVVDENNVSVLTSSPNGRYDQMGCRLAGWVPPATGIYYVKVWGTPEKLAAEMDPSYQMRFWYGTPISEAADLHEPDDTAAEAVLLDEIPTDGSMVRGYLYKNWVEGDSIDTNFNDFDLYKVTVPEAGLVLIAETFTSARLYDHPEWCRDVDTEIYLLDENGAIIPGMKNDDKAAWAGDPWDKGNALSPGVNNTYSRLVTPAIPAAGVYYVQVNSYYNNLLEGRTKSPANTDKDPGGGEYLVSLKLVAADDPSVASTFLPLDEVRDGSIAESDTMDVWQIEAEDDKMYTIATVTDPLKFQAKSVLQMDVVDAMGQSVLTSSPNGRYDQMGCRLAGWVPPATGIYYVKVWGAPDVLAELENTDYQMRFWYGTPVADAAALHEPDDTAEEAVLLDEIPTDGTMVRGYLYKNWVEGDSIDTNFNDFDLYKVTVPEAGMILTAETFTSAGLYDHPEWCRDVDTEVYLLDENGVIIPGMKNDDKKLWGGDPWDNDNPLTPGVSNTYSRLITPAIPEAGTYYVQVNSYYNNLLEGRTKSPANTDKDPGGGEYQIAITISSPAEMEPNNDMASANLIPLETVTDAALAADDSVDYFKFTADADKMYTLNTIAPRGVTLKSVLEMMIFDVNGDSVLTSSPNGRYDAWGPRLTGWIPPETGTYYCKISADVSEVTEPISYQIRLWYGTDVSLAASVHEPDNTPAEAAAFGPIDLTLDPFEIHSFLYADYVDSLGNHYNWNDFDLYQVDLVAGDILTAEVFTAGPDSCIRDLDTEIYLTDADGVLTQIKNDDKDAWSGDHWEDVLEGVSNTFSRFVSPAIPEDGTYYIQVNSYYNNLLEGRTKSPENVHKDPGGGEYILKVRVNVPVAVDEKVDNVPLTFELKQNYPNPFNPTTTINYSIPNSENVKLTVYNMLGQDVAELVNEKQQAGKYNVTWDATDKNGMRMSTGVYFFRIEAGSFVKVNKMILLK